MEDCIFCKIIGGLIPATIVYEDERVLAFNDIRPAAPIHVLIVPKEHIGSLEDVDAGKMQVVADVHLAARKIAAKLGIAQKGYRLINNCGPDAGQTVHHLHYHLLGGRSLGERLL